MNLGAAAFWIALAAVMIAGSYFRLRREALKQQMLLQLVEKTGQLDEQQLRLICPPPAPPPPHWFRQPQPTDGRVAMRICGTIVLSFAAGLALFFTVLLRFGTASQQSDAIVGYAWTGLIACIGVGLLIAGRFIRLPPATKAIE